MDTQSITQHGEAEEVARIASPGSYQGQHSGTGSSSSGKKRVQRSSVLDSHGRKGRSRNADPEIGAEVVQPVANLFLSRK